MVVVHQHAQTHQRRGLLRGGEVHGEVLGDLAGDQVHLAHVGLLQAKVLDDGHLAVPAHRRANRQLLARAREIDSGIVHVALHAQVAVGHRQHRADGAAALDLHADGLPVVLQHAAHHGRAGQRAPQRRRGDAGEVMGIHRLLHHLRALDQDGPGLPVHQGNIINAVAVHCVH